MARPGRAAAARLHERGASVAVNVRNRERAERWQRRSASAPSPCRATSRRTASPPDRAPHARALRTDRHPRQQRRASAVDTLSHLTVEEWRTVIEVNLTAPSLMTKAVLPSMRAQHYGRIINISSSAGRMVTHLAVRTIRHRRLDFSD